MDEGPHLDKCDSNTRKLRGREVMRAREVRVQMGSGHQHSMVDGSKGTEHDGSRVRDMMAAGYRT